MVLPQNIYLFLSYAFCKFKEHVYNWAVEILAVDKSVSSYQ